MNAQWGRFTACGGPEVEATITAIVSEVAAAFQQRLSADRFRALALIGGYGRGEGGVEVVDGCERPHNNLDFLLILNAGSPAERAAVKQEMDELLKTLSVKHSLGLDLGIVTVPQLMHSDSLVMWYDMRFGHKTVLGDADFIPSLTQFSVEKIPAYDVRNLMVNRGTLCLINDALLEKGDLTLAERKTIVKHAIKAIIGYGDALLYFLGAYHWSYAEKRARMRARTDVPPGFQALYEEAISFRFQPRYDVYLQRDLGEWMAWLYSQLEAVHLQCEARRLGRQSLTWGEYADAAFQHVLVEDLFSVRGLAKKVRRLISHAPDLHGASLLAQLGCRCGGMQSALPILFPTIAYPASGRAERERAMRLLTARDTTLRNLRRAYLQAWGAFGDINFPTVLNKLGISLTPVESAA